MESVQFDSWVLCCEYPENFVGEGLANRTKSGKVKYDNLEQLHSGKQALCLRAGNQLVIPVFRKPHRNHGLIKSVVITPGELVKYFFRCS